MAKQKKHAKNKSMTSMWIGAIAVIIILIIIGFVLFGDKKGTMNDTQDTVAGTDETSNTATQADNASCDAAVQAYLADADMEGDGNTVENGNTVIVDYIGRLDNGEVFDTSVVSVAQACNVYNPQRNYDEGLSFTAGGGQMIAGFDQAVMGMREGQTQTITIPSADAYGARTEEALQTIPAAQIPNIEQYEVGQEIATQYGTVVKIHAINENEVVIDANHPLAGKDLIFDITIKTIE